MNQCALTPGKVFSMIDHPLRVHRIYPTQMTLQQLYHDHVLCLMRAAMVRNSESQ